MVYYIWENVSYLVNFDYILLLIRIIFIKFALRFALFAIKKQPKIINQITIYHYEEMFTFS